MPEQKETHTRIGIGVMILKDGKVLLGKRKSVHGSGEWAFPGGHLEYMERFEECARREVAEECGIELSNIRFQYLANLKRYAPRHYVHIGLVADWKSGEVKLLEPNKCENWELFTFDTLPKPLFFGTELIIQAYKNGPIYRDDA
jgi:8-oxo-dGTP diphosphatase